MVKYYALVRDPVLYTTYILLNIFEDIKHSVFQKILWAPHTGGPVAFSTAIITYRLLFVWCRKLFDLAVVDCITPDHVGSGCAIVYCMKTEAL